MKVIILSAGISSRLSKITKDIPKCLLPVSNSTILGLQLEAIDKVRLNDVIISAGYMVSKIENYLYQTNIKNLNIQIEYNPFYDISNNIISLWNVRHLIKNQPVIIINGDNIFDYKILELLLKCPHDNVIMINKKEEYDGDDMKVQLSGERIVKINKSMSSSQAAGESIGIMKFSATFTDELMNWITLNSRNKEYLQAWYLKAVQGVIDEGENVYACSIGDYKWDEVDFPEDYLKVCRDWPIYEKERGWKYVG